MKKMKKSKVNKESTITDVMGAVQKLSGKFDVLEGNVQDLTEAVQVGFAKVEERFDKVEGIVGRHEKILTTLVTGQENLTERVNSIDKRLSVTQNRVEDIADSLGDITRVADKDRVSTLDHERRIRHLERARG